MIVQQDNRNSGKSKWGEKLFSLCLLFFSLYSFCRFFVDSGNLTRLLEKKSLCAVGEVGILFLLFCLFSFSASPVCVSSSIPLTASRFFPLLFLPCLPLRLSAFREVHLFRKKAACFSIFRVLQLQSAFCSALYFDTDEPQ